MTSTKDLVYKARVSDPNAKVSGSYNGQELSTITPNKTTGEFTLSGIDTKKGKNELKLQASSKLGTVTPLVAAITYDPNALSISNLTRNPVLFGAFIVNALTAIIIGLLLYFFVYRKRKRLEKESSTATDNHDSGPT